MSRALMPMLFAAMLAGCGNTRDKPAPPTTTVSPENHSAFPITEAPHNLECNVCHGGFESFQEFNCLGCHAHQKRITDPLHLGEPNYAYNSAACYSCHADGAGRPFSHTGISGNCAMCHEEGAVFAALPKPGFEHPERGNSDCGACHVTSGWKGASSAPDGAHDPLRDLEVQALIPTYSNARIASLSPSTQLLPMPMRHNTTQVATAGLSNCVNCHPDASEGAYFPGTLHAALSRLNLAQPSGCTDCHAKSAPLGLVGPVASGRTPPSGPMKHDAVAWKDGVPTATLLANQECSVCHVTPAAEVVTTWLTGAVGGGRPVFHASLTQAQKEQPGSCVDCHANSVPTALLTPANASLPVGMTFDHDTAQARADCAACHVSTTAPQWTTWAGGRFHLAGSTTPSTCLPCHEGQRPTSTANWKSTTFQKSPFDYVTNSLGISHGAGQDCVTCHSGPGTGVWGSTHNWVGGNFKHGPNTLSATTCISCHTTQRPDLLPNTTAAAMATLLGFDHAVNGTGNCFGCHQATVAAGSYLNLFHPTTGVLPGGDWKGGVTYPGTTRVGSPNQFINVTQTKLVRSPPANLITSTTSSVATLYNEFIHTSANIPASVNPGPAANPDQNSCRHCHTTNQGVTTYANGVFHSALTNYTATPGGAVTPLPQPTQCGDCHANVRPADIVEKGTTRLQPMDHQAQFAAPASVGGATVSGAGQVECAVCHQSPGNTWSDGQFHSRIGAASPQDCAVCHYPLMADATRADVTSGTRFSMRHRSTQVPVQNCKTCHPSALAKATTTPTASTLWSGGLFHPSLTAQPTTCVECHVNSKPNTSTQSSVVYALALGGTATNGAQWMSHASTHVAGRDCAVCHRTDAKTTGSAWSPSTSFHAVTSNPATCRECHGLTNGGGTTPGTNNNLPSGLTNSDLVSSAAANSSTGVPGGTRAQISHADINVTGKDCNFCHTQVGRSTNPAVQGKEWAQASFHGRFNAANPLVLNGTTGRCSNCHLNVKPGPSYLGFNHTALTSAPGSADCSSCHAWPGSGTAATPNWKGAAGGYPSLISVGGFSIGQPPESVANKPQVGINNLPHPNITGVACTTCHQQAAGGKQAKGYDHASALINANCRACHEAGSNLVGTSWSPTATTVNAVCSEGSGTIRSGTGDTRAVGLSSLACSDRASTRTCGNANCVVNHFYPADCSECHVKPTGVRVTSTGTAYAQAWRFPHTRNNMQAATCCMCHQASGGGSCRP